MISNKCSSLLLMEPFDWSHRMDVHDTGHIVTNR